MVVIIEIMYKNIKMHYVYIGSSPTTDTFRNHSKLKRFLTTLVHFSGQISPQTSERVKGQIFTLVVS